MSVVGLRNLPRLDRQAKQFRFLIGSAGVAGTDATSSKELRLLRLLLSQPFLPPLNNNSHQPSSHRSTTVTSLPPTIQQQSPAFLPLLNNNNSHQPSSHHSTTVTSLPPAAQQSPAYLPPFNNSHQPSSHRSTAVTSLPPAAQQQQSPAFLPLLNNTVTSLPPAVQQQPNHQPSSRGSITTQSQPSSRSTTVTSLPPTVPQQSPAFLPLLNNNPITSLPPAAQQQPNHQTSSAAQQQQSPAFLPLLNNKSPAFLPPLNNNPITSLPPAVQQQHSHIRIRPSATELAAPWSRRLISKSFVRWSIFNAGLRSKGRRTMYDSHHCLSLSLFLFFLFLILSKLQGKPDI